MVWKYFVSNKYKTIKLKLVKLVMIAAVLLYYHQKTIEGGNEFSVIGCTFYIEIELEEIGDFP